MAIDKKLAQEGADWIAEMASDDLGGFIPAEFCDLVMEAEELIREESGDAEMDHATMAARMMARFEADPDVPMQHGKITAALITEILHWEDEFLYMAGHTRRVRQS